MKIGRLLLTSVVCCGFLSTAFASIDYKYVGCSDPKDPSCQNACYSTKADTLESIYQTNKESYCQSSATFSAKLDKDKNYQTVCAVGYPKAFNVKCNYSPVTVKK